MKRLSVFFFVLLIFFPRIFSNDYVVDRLNEQRITVASEKIAADFKRNMCLQLCARAANLAIVVGTAYVAYRIWRGFPECKHQAAEEDLFNLTRELNPENKQHLIDIGRTIQEKQQMEKMPKFVQRTGSSFVSLSRFIIPKVLTDLLISFSSQRWVAPFGRAIDAVLAERNIKWFILQRTRLLQLMQQLKSSAVVLDARSSILTSIDQVGCSLQPVETDQLGALASVNEMIGLKTQALAMQERYPLSERELHNAKQYIVLIMREVIWDVERLLAFIRYRYTEQGDVATHLYQQVDDISIAIESLLQGEPVSSGLLARSFELGNSVEKAVELILANEQIVGAF